MTDIQEVTSSNVVIEKHHYFPPTTWKTYFTFSHDHKVIGIQYLVTAFVSMLIGGIFAMIIRGELITPESDLVDRTVYNAMFTMHGTVMLFGWTFPSLEESTRVRQKFFRPSDFSSLDHPYISKLSAIALGLHSRYKGDTSVSNAYSGGIMLY